MSETLCMVEIEEILEEVSRVSQDVLTAWEELHEVKQQAIKELTRHYGLNLDDAQSEVAAAAGEEP